MNNPAHPIPQTQVYYQTGFIPSGSLEIGTGNRAFRYGDGLFESIRVCKGVPLFFAHHYSRFILGLDVLRIEIPEHWQPDFLKKTIEELCRSNGQLNARVRLSAWRSGGGYYLPGEHSAELLIESSGLSDPFYAWPSQGLRIDLAEDIHLGNRALDRIKSANALPYIMAAIQAKERGLDDLILCDAQGHLLEASSSNLFLFREGVLYSPNPELGGIDGIMRRVLVKIARKEGISFVSTELNTEDLLLAEEIFLSNAISGIRWVSSFRDRTYPNQFSLGLFGKLEEKILAELQR